MSCKNKLSNLPILSNINEQFKKLAPSNLEGLSSKLKAQKIADGFGDMAGDLAKQVGNQISNFANDATGKLSNLGGLVSGLGTDLKAGIPEDLKGIKTSIANGIISAKNQISKQYENMKSAFDCEDGVTSNSLSSTQETTKLKSAVMATSVSQTKNLSNKDIKNVTENSDYKNQKTQEVTNSTISKGESIASDSQSNKEVVNTQNKALSGLQSVAVINEDNFSAQINKSSLAVYNGIKKGNDEWIVKLDKVVALGDERIKKVFSVKTGTISVEDFKTCVKNIHIATDSTNLDFEDLRKAYNQNYINLDTANANLELLNGNLLKISHGINYTIQVDSKNKKDIIAVFKQDQEASNYEVKKMNSLDQPVVVNWFKAPIVAITK